MTADFENFLRLYIYQQMQTEGNGSSSDHFQGGNSSTNSTHNLPPGGGDGHHGFDPSKDFMPEELPASVRSTFTVFYVIIMLLAVTGNATTIMVIAVNREMRTVTNIFLLSLAISDALIALVNMPVQLNFYLHNEWTMGEAMCKFSPYMQAVVIVASILTLTTLALDRYYAICHPLRARHVHTITRAIILASVIWAVALLLVLPQIFIQRLEPKLHFGINEETGKPILRTVYMCAEYFGEDHRLAIAYTSVFYVILYVFPVITMFATYGTIATKLWRRRPIGESAESAQESNRRLREKQRIVRMLVVIVVMFAVSWFPFFTLQVYLLFEDAKAHELSFRVAMAFFQLLGYSNSCVNPIVYCFMNDSFQKNFFKTLWCRWMAKEAASKGRRRSSCTDGDRINGGTTAASTRHSALDHTTSV